MPQRSTRMPDTCFVCLEPAAALACGSCCKTAFVCPQCAWTMMTRCAWTMMKRCTALGLCRCREIARCKVCMGYYGDLVILAGMRHGRASVAALPHTDAARTATEAQAMGMLLAMEDSGDAVAEGLAIVAAYAAALGEGHECTVMLKQHLGNVYASFGGEEAALPCFREVAAAQQRAVGERDYLKAGPEDRRKLLRFYRVRLQIAMTTWCAQVKRGAVADPEDEAVECELRELVDLLAPVESVVAGNCDYVLAVLFLADMLVKILTLGFGSAAEPAEPARPRPRTRRQLRAASRTRSRLSRRRSTRWLGSASRRSRATHPSSRASATCRACLPTALGFAHGRVADEIKNKRSEKNRGNREMYEAHCKFQVQTTCTHDVFVAFPSTYVCSLLFRSRRNVWAHVYHHEIGSTDKVDR
jgi:hypothetical protein